METKSILFVDDEEQILKALRRLFANESYTLFFAESGEKALSILQEEKIDLMVTDIRMPEMDGFELLSQVKKLYPGIMRVVLSGYTDNKKIFKALDENLAKQYILKPWNNDLFVDSVKKLFLLESILSDTHILNLINNMNSLPSLPRVFTEINALIEKDVNMDLIVKKLEEDQAISSRILKVANSAFFGAKTGSISQAAVFVGLGNIKNIVLTNAVFDTKVVQNEKMAMLWEHSKKTNAIMNMIYQKFLNKKVTHTYASAGLLHDIGKVVFFAHFNERYLNVFSEDITFKTTDILKRENEMIGINHELMGGYLLNWWGLPVPIIESALYHHDPLNTNIINRELVSIIHLANFYSKSGKDLDKYKCELNTDVFDYLRINKFSLEKNLYDYFKIEGSIG